MTGPNRSRPDPGLNLADPLSEPTLQRRLRAAYESQGWNRYKFAKALSVAYSTVDAWDEGKAEPKLKNLIDALKLLKGYDLNGLVFGHRGLPEAGTEPRLTDDALRAVLDELGADEDSRAAIGEWQASPRGKFQPWTRSYVLQWLTTHIAARQAGADADAAQREAANAGLNADDLAKAAAMGVQPVTVGALDQFTAPPTPRKRPATKPPSRKLRPPTRKRR